MAGKSGCAKWRPCTGSATQPAIARGMSAGSAVMSTQPDSMELRGIESDELMGFYPLSIAADEDMNLFS